MEWSNLKIAACPACGLPLKSQGILEPMYFCTGKQCKFSISEAKAKEIVTDRSKPKKRRVVVEEEENLSDLNNYGREIDSEDFSNQQPDS